MAIGASLEPLANWLWDRSPPVIDFPRWVKLTMIYFWGWILAGLLVEEPLAHPVGIAATAVGFLLVVLSLLTVSIAESHGTDD